MKIPKVTKYILIINIIAFVSTYILENIYKVPVISTFGAFNFHSGNFRCFQLITYMFLHANLMHIAFNMIVFVSLGSYVENYIGSKRFLIYYLFCGVISAVIFLAVSNKNDVALIGASGAIFGMITLFMFYFPNEKLYVFFIPIGIKAKYLIPVMIGIEVVSSIFFSGSEVAHLGHVGGVVGGIIIFATGRLTRKS